MGAINYGNQLITLDYYSDMTSATVNQRFMKTYARGIYDGGYLTKVSNTSVTLSTLVCEIGDSSYQVQTKTQSTVTVTVSVATPWVVLRWTYTGAISNYTDVLAVAAGSIQANDLVVGECTFAGSTLTGFNYNDTTHPRSTPEVLTHHLKVVPTETASMVLRVYPGKVSIGTSIVRIGDQTTSAIVAPISNPRIDLVWLDRSGTVRVQTGTEAASPSAPAYNDRLVLAEIYLTVGQTTITASSIRDVRQFIAPLQRAETTANMTMYVRTDGSDSNDGFSNTSSGAKLTLRGALDAIPTMIKHQVIIQFGDGTYDMSGYVAPANHFLIDKVVVGANSTSSGGALIIQGNVSNRDLVIFNGPGATANSTININGTQVRFRYLRFVNIFINLLNNAYMYMQVCSHVQTGFDGSQLALTMSEAHLEDVNITSRMNYIYQGVIQAHDHSKLRFASCTFVGAGKTSSCSAIDVHYLSSLVVTDCVFSDYAMAIGVGASASAWTYGGMCTAYINAGSITNCNYGIRMACNSHALYQGSKPTYSGCGTNESLQAGSDYTLMAF